MANTSSKIEFGDYQTPSILTELVCNMLLSAGEAPKTVIEPTCGTGTFLHSAAKHFPTALSLIGLDMNPEHVEVAKRLLAPHQGRKEVLIQHADFFTFQWPRLIQSAQEPILIIGNPPWTTNSKLGTMNSQNLPPKSNFKSVSGIAAQTGSGNFDISEWMLIQTLHWLQGKQGTLAVLCKHSVALKVLAYAWKNNLDPSEARIYPLDASKYFGVSVNACLLVCSFSPSLGSKKEAALYSSIERGVPKKRVGYRDGMMVGNLDLYEKWQHLQGSGADWRSGIKHDCIKVMELTREKHAFINGLGEQVELEEEFVYPMLKSSELMAGKGPTRWMIVTQRSVGEETSNIRVRAPKLWKYLTDHSEYFHARKSSIYKGRPQFAIFGVGDYTFSPWKVAISAFSKKPEFRVVGPLEGQPVIFDDTQNFVSCRSKQHAYQLARTLNSGPAKSFFESIIGSWEEKRPLTIGVLKRLDLARLQEELGESTDAYEQKQAPLFHPAAPHPSR